MTATATRPSTDTTSLRTEQLRQVALMIPNASLAEVVESGRHPKVSFTLPNRYGHDPIPVLLGERVLSVGGTRAPEANFVGLSIDQARRVVLDQGLRHVADQQVREHFAGYRTVAGTSATQRMVWLRSTASVWTGTGVSLTVQDPATGRHLHLEVDRDTVAVRLDSSSAAVLSPAAARVHLERLADSYGRTYATVLEDLLRFGAAVLDHPVVTAAAIVAAEH